MSITLHKLREQTESESDVMKGGGGGGGPRTKNFFFKSQFSMLKLYHLLSYVFRSFKQKKKSMQYQFIHVHLAINISSQKLG